MMRLQSPINGKRSRLRLLWIATGLILGLLAGLLYLRRSTDPLTTERLANARALWQERGPVSYQFELELGGAIEDRRLVQVREGEVVAMTSDGVEVPASAWPYWTVEGMFASLEQELQNAAHPQRIYGISDPERVLLQAEFDPELGYPSRFLRHVLGTRQSIEWTTVVSRAE